MGETAGGGEGATPQNSAEIPHQPPSEQHASSAQSPFPRFPLPHICPSIDGNWADEGAVVDGAIDAVGEAEADGMGETAGGGEGATRQCSAEIPHQPHSEQHASSAQSPFPRFPLPHICPSSDGNWADEGAVGEGAIDALGEVEASETMIPTTTITTMRRATRINFLLAHSPLDTDAGCTLPLSSDSSVDGTTSFRLL